MGKEQLQLIAFNRGLISSLALARIDLKRSAFAAQTMDNWAARSLGSMMLRPGLGYLTTTSGNAAARYLPFIFRTDDTALIEFTAGAMRVLIDDALITRPMVSSAITNGLFTTDLTGWTDSDDAGGTSSWVTDAAGHGYMALLGNGTANAIRDQKITVAGDSLNIEHGIHINVFRGPVNFRIGSAIGGTQYQREITLRTGYHSIAVTPTGDFWLRFSSPLDRYCFVHSVAIEAAGAMTLTSPYAASDLDNIRGGRESQSGDIIFLACEDLQQRRVERSATRSWSIVLYEANDGPFRDPNASSTTITPSTIAGDITLTASAPIFNIEHIGALFSITSDGQIVTGSATAQNVFTDPIRVTGVGSGRTFYYAITAISTTGTTGTLQRSLTSETGPWADVSNTTVDATSVYDDTLDNQIAWYRVGVKTGNYSTGTIGLGLTYNNGSITGTVRVTGYTSTTSVAAQVLTHLGGSIATSNWAEGKWSDFRGWPTAVSFYEGRLVWAGKNGLDASTTDAFDTFLDENSDGTAVGDSGPIERNIGSGPVDVINWILPLQRLILGGQGGEFTVRSDALDAPLTATNVNLKNISGQGSAGVQGVKVDNHGLYVQRGGIRVYELGYAQDGTDYTSTDATVFIPTIGGEPGTGTHIVRMDVQRQPDTRVHCIRSDGKAAVLVYDKAEQILCWLTYSSPDATFEDVVVLPSEAGAPEDRVYYVVKRTVNGATQRSIERMAFEYECQGGTLNKQADSFLTFTNTPPSVLVSVPHLIGETVVCWHDGACELDANDEPRTYVVAADGNITLDTEATTGVVGIAYEAQWQSNFLGHTLPAVKIIQEIGAMLENTHPRGLRWGTTLDDADMDYLPLVDNGAPVDVDTIYSTFSSEPITFPGDWNTDARLCLKAQSPLPVTILAATVIGRSNV